MSEAQSRQRAKVAEKRKRREASETGIAIIKKKEKEKGQEGPDWYLGICGILLYLVDYALLQS
jgi:hypothetical protein